MPLVATSWDHWSSATELHDEPEPLIATKLVLAAPAGLATAARPSAATARAPATRAAPRRKIFTDISLSPAQPQKSAAASRMRADAPQAADEHRPRLGREHG